MRRQIIVFIFICFLLSGCSATEIDTSPRNIDPTIDICPICHMSIIDEHYAAQVIDDQGQVQSFDDIGCLSIYMRRLEAEGLEETVLAAYVKDFESVEWITAEEANFVQGEISTPMSFGIVAFTTEEKAQKFNEHIQGRLLNWEQVLKEKLTIGLDVEFKYEEFDIKELTQEEVLKEEEK